MLRHELQNAYRTRKILTGTLGGIEKMQSPIAATITAFPERRMK